MKYIKSLSIFLTLLSVYTSCQNSKKSSLTLLSDRIPTDTPVVFGDEIISTDSYEFAITFTLEMDGIYVTRRKPEEDKEIYTMKLVEGKWSNPEPAFFTASEGWDFEPHTADIDGKNIIQLTDNKAQEWHPDISPDGRHNAFMSDRDENNEIYVMNIDSFNLKRLTNNDIDDWYPSWSPDGSKISFSAVTCKERKDRTIYIMNKDGSSLEKTTSNGTHPSWLRIA